jgi:hypothetical protein
MASTPDLLKRRRRQNYGAVKLLASVGEIALIERHDCAGPSVNCGFQNHVVVRIGQPWPPSEGESNGPCHRCQVIKDTPDFGTPQSAGGQMLWPGQHGFILERERYREQQLELPVQSSQQKLAGSASITPQGRNHHVRVEHVRIHHYAMILHAISCFNQNAVCSKERGRLPQTRESLPSDPHLRRSKVRKSGGAATNNIAEYALALAASQIILLADLAKAEEDEVPF